jgi:hypothetical protein
MEPIKITRDMLPNLPDEIYGMFVVPQNDAPLNIFDNHPRGRWFVHFGGLTIEEFNNLSWHRAELSFDEDIFHPDTYGDIERLIASHKNPPMNTLLPRNPTDSRERLIWHRNTIIDTGRLCAPIVCIRTSIGLKLLDGVHRVVAALSINGSETISLGAWIGE